MILRLFIVLMVIVLLDITEDVIDLWGSFKAGNDMPLRYIIYEYMALVRDLFKGVFLIFAYAFLSNVNKEDSKKPSDIID